MDEVLASRRFTTYPVVHDGRAVGLLPFRSVAEIPRGDWDGRTVGDCMLRLDQVPVLAPDDQVVDVLDELGESDVQRALVLDDGRLVGLLSITDLARALQIGGYRRP
jgi:CBS domain-containing protein